MNTVNLNNTYPIFEADQVLTADHLNEMFNYLEEQERWTRAKLIGSGIVCGLEISLDNNGGTVVIDKGVGLTSKGYLITFNEQEPEDASTAYNYFTPYTDPNEDKYSLFRNNNQDIELYELQETRIENAESLGNLPLSINEYGVLLYLECLDKKLKNCVENDCNEKGTERIFTLRKLLVSKTELRRIICEEQSLNTPKSEAQLEEIVNARYKNPGIKLPRFNNKGLPVTNYNQFYAIYKIMIDESMTLVKNALLDSFDYFYPIFKAGYGTKTNFQNVVNISLQDHYNDLMSSDLCQLQYFYDLLCDLAENYNAFIDAAFDLMSECCPALDRFPKHLRLGSFDVDDCPPSVYRTTFVQAPIHNSQKELREKVLTLHANFSIFVFEYTDVSAYTDIKITPSVALDQELSKKAIPYYYQYSDVMLKYWNSDLRRKCRERENLWYHAAEYATEPPIQHVLNPLAYSLKKSDFFRIEGHICKNYQTALSDILRQRRVNNLAFDVIALKLGTDAEDTSFDATDCNFRDLELLCQTWKKELECMLSDGIKTYSGYSTANLLENAAAVELVLLKNTPKGATAKAAATAAEATTPSWVNEGITKNVVDSMSKKEGDMGYYIAKAMETQSSNACVYKDDAKTQAVEYYPYLGNLTAEEIAIAIDEPFAIMTRMVALAILVETECADLDLAAIKTEMDLLVADAQQHTQAMEVYQTNATARLNYNYSALSNANTALISNCTVEALELIQAEMAKRKAEIKKKNLFHEYLSKNPGMEHAGGVPKGGTFVLVYRGGYSSSEILGERAATGYSVSGFVLDESGAGLPGATIIVKHSVLGAICDLDGRFTLSVPAGVHTLEAQVIGQTFNEVTIQGPWQGILFSPATKQEAKIGPDVGKVVADFYLPYLCCSDCPPVAYVFQESPVVDVSLNMITKKFCVPYSGTPEPFIVSPVDGEVTGVVSNEGITGVAGAYAFDPNTVDLGGADQKTLKFNVNGEEQLLEVVVCDAPAPSLTLTNFTWDDNTFFVDYNTPLSLADGTWLWQALTTDAAGAKVEIGSQTGGGTFNISSDVPIAGEDLTVMLTVTYPNGCIANNEDTNSVPAKDIVPTLDITPSKKFCVGDNPGVFVVTPDGGVVTGQTNNDGIGNPAPGVYTFDPALVDLQGKEQQTFRFQVDGVDMPLVITVCAKPVVVITEDAFGWIDGGSFDAKFSTTLDEGKTNWDWKMEREKPGQGVVEEDVQTGGTAFVPNTLKAEEGDTIRIILSAFSTSTKCTGVGVYEKEIPPRDGSTGKITLELFNAQGLRIDNVPFDTSDTNTYSLVAKPGEGILNSQDIDPPAFFREGMSIDFIQNSYKFIPGIQEEGSYTFEYKLADGTTGNITLVIMRGAKPPLTVDGAMGRLTGGKTALTNLESAPLYGKLLADNEAYITVSNMVDDLEKNLSIPSKVNRYKTGKESRRLTKSLNNSTATTTTAIIAESRTARSRLGSRRASNNRNQNYLLEFYRLQINIAANLLAIQEKDLLSIDPLSKHLTIVKKQFARMKKKNINVDVSKKMGKLLRDAKKEMADKPKATAKLDSLLNAL